MAGGESHVITKAPGIEGWAISAFFVLMANASYNLQQNVWVTRFSGAEKLIKELGRITGQVHLVFYFQKNLFGFTLRQHPCFSLVIDVLRLSWQ